MDIRSLAQGTAVFGVVFVLWLVAGELSVISEEIQLKNIFLRILSSVKESPGLHWHFMASVRRLFFGLSMAIFSGTLIGIVLSRHDTLREAVSPFLRLQMLYPAFFGFRYFFF